MLVSSFNLSQSFKYTPHLFYKKRFKTEINSFLYMDPGKSDHLSTEVLPEI